ncbi:MAG: AgmX/PglI C-terminal domain-containing protein [Deltaproteobacteria bacterium]|nr:AgmX/PglI C-terminal domain-containing protein [Deltaproteobacteria bacterium]
MKHLIVSGLLVVALGACGKKGSTMPDEEHTAPIGPGDGPVYTSDPNQIPAEKMDETQRLLDRKRGVVSRCLAFAVDNKDLPKNSRGKVTLQIIIDTSGSPTTVKVINTTLESKSLEECVIGHVKKIQFPTMPRKYETSYTYAFEAV